MNEQLRRAAAAEDFAGVGDPGALEAIFATGGRRAISPASPAEAALVQAYRDRGFLRSRLDPLGLAPLPAVPELDPARYGLEARSAASLIESLELTYCGPIGWEFGHIHDTARRRWLEAEAEGPASEPPDAAPRLALLTQVHTFETVLTQRLPGARLFGLGGAESLIALVESLLVESVPLGLEEVVIGGMHRGRFNLLANVCGKPLGALLAGVQGRPSAPEGLDACSDVSYHLGYSGEREIAGRAIRLSVSPHPSHLQIAPVISQGRARAKQWRHGLPGGRRAVLPLLLHTDASFAGQGLVAEMFQLSRLAPYELGGTVHVVINNQLGFTTLPEEGRSARCPTDIARLVEAPVLHVNGDDPDAVCNVAAVAARWRAAFASDIVIDLVCYRRPGHNEFDEPRFTQPLMYRAIDARPPVHELYAASLAAARFDVGCMREAALTMSADIGAGFEAAKSYAVNRADRFEGAWAGFGAGTAAEMLVSPATGVPLSELRRLGALLTVAPPGFAVDPKVERFLQERRQSIEVGEGLSWATGEALAFASLIAEGTALRFSGQDAVRGAFTQRHLELHDQVTGARHLVLGPVACGEGQVEVHNTPLIEHAVLCFEYGMSLADPRRLVVWEAQFGEFLNIAQPVFDQCIACGEDRWLRSSGLVILLPHGLDGGGPDHSTGRPERLLAACAGANLVVANVSTPANFFHLLRRQMHWPFRKPLVVLTPKSLLRHKACVSPLAAFGPGTAFRPVIPDGEVSDARRVVLCTGKVSYELRQARAERGLEDAVALVRIEQLHPFPSDALAALLAKHPRAELVWCEEEPENMGYFRHLGRDLERAAGRPLRRAGRPASATPAVGVKSWHDDQARALVADALGSG
ncbi:MAG: 2-oxoglutarate dehydrogenase E1 component [Hyphomicrobiaceae bacterium]|nr:2-oxoglutarate dehydrogenase E1 component [Hyphomicrobiaceae bacterium]